ncbi:lipid-A-disaccharide synthase [Aliidiomarina halalkaliphila]|uniref:Lipid-A-disaccharide synthase n=1 Tax=Aliidiomarina halalkaliphila TaxID=2593535 RepID=A0A552X3J1_9GAMM|nr:lipid-A-disaccharide synthase [Aliidiomarina halalkaliphila]TRW49582.1 lipid-A-disaccharide synthase [Aliidiomarina halalkaliphila]
MSDVNCTTTSTIAGAHERPLLIGIVAGEASGDILGANLMKALSERHHDVQFVGVGGARMSNAGLVSLFPMETLSVMGIVDVLKQLPSLLRARKQVVQAMLTRKPDVFIGIDAPDFNLPIEKKLKAAGIPTVHYVSPSVWAWRPKRIFGIAEATELVLGILPFEADFYAKYQVPYKFVGHPLADEIPLEWSKQSAREALALTGDKTYVGILPGSRGSEVGLLAEPFIDAAIRLQDEHPNLEFLVAFANEKRQDQFLDALKKRETQLRIHTFLGHSQTVIAASDVTMLASGTVSLETMLIKRPMVVCYRFGWLNYQLLRHFVSLPHFSLPNLLEGGPLVLELLQSEVTGTRIADEINQLLEHDQSAALARFAEHHAMLRRDAGKEAALAVLQLIR